MDVEGLAEVRVGCSGSPTTCRRTARAGEWHEYGGLIVNLRNVIDAVSRVAAPGPLPRLAQRTLRRLLRRAAP